MAKKLLFFNWETFPLNVSHWPLGDLVTVGGLQKHRSGHRLVDPERVYVWCIGFKYDSELLGPSNLVFILSVYSISWLLRSVHHTTWLAHWRFWTAWKILRSILQEVCSGWVCASWWPWRLDWWLDLVLLGMVDFLEPICWWAPRPISHNPLAYWMFNLD